MVEVHDNNYVWLCIPLVVSTTKTFELFKDHYKFGSDYPTYIIESWGDLYHTHDPLPIPYMSDIVTHKGYILHKEDRLCSGPRLAINYCKEKLSGWIDSDPPSDYMGGYIKLEFITVFPKYYEMGHNE